MERPESIGRYKILRELGHGGMGTVYLAHDPAIDRQVAIKTVCLDNDSNDLINQRQRFFLEAQAAGRLQHPNIIAVHDIGTFNDGDMFIVMEYLSGSTLDTFAQKPDLLPTERIIALLSDACLALDFAHLQRIVHRDIKPSNMMLVNGRVKITDFGIAKDYRSQLTQCGLLLGTPNYMSPEQARGGEVDGRSDLFSMGIVLYELLTGQRPFQGESITAVLYQLVHEEPEPPQLLNHTLPGRFDDLLRTALHKDPGSRFQTGLEMAAALRSLSRFEASPAQTLAIRREGLHEALPELAHIPEVSPHEPVAQRRSDAESRPATAVTAPRQRSSLVVAIGLLAALAALAIPEYRALWLRTILPAMDGVLQAGPAARREPPSTASSAKVGLIVPAPTEVQLVADRVGARFQVDGAPVEKNTLTWTPALAGQILSASDGCYRGEIELTTPGSELTRLEVTLTEPVVRSVEVRTDPQGASVVLDGKKLEARTPASALLSVCEDHDVTLSLAGYRTRKLSLSAEGNWDEVMGAPLRLETLPTGRLFFDAGYLVTIYDDQGKRLGTSAEVLSLPQGKHKLRFESRQHRVSVSKTFTVETDTERSLPAPVPGLGTIRVLVYPGNAVIRVDGVDADAPPVVLQLGAGEHRIECHWNTGEGKTVHQTVFVREGQTHKIHFLDEDDLDDPS